MGRFGGTGAKELNGRHIPAVTSQQVAAAFGKEHKNVLRDIDRILSQVPEIFGRLNFQPSEYELKNNLGFPVKHPMYIITKDGLMMVTMGYTTGVRLRRAAAKVAGKSQGAT